MAEITLSDAERGAAALAVAHLIDKHGYSSIASRTGPSVDLEALYKRLVKATPTPEGDSRP